MRTTFLIILVSILLAACGGSITKPLDRTPSPLSKAENIQQLLSNARNASSPIKEQLQLEAAALLIEEKQRDLAQRIIDNLPHEQLSPQLFAEYSFIKSELQILNGDFETARISLETQKLLNTFDQLSHETQISLSLLRAKVYALLGSHIASVQQRIYINPLLDDAVQQSNRDAIWESLMYVAQYDLTHYLLSSMGGEYEGWLQLALIAKENKSDLDQQINRLEAWQLQWFDHPANKNLPGGLHLIKQLAAERPQQVALLLPLTGKLAPFGKAIRDGFIAAMYETRGNGGTVPTLKIYDSESSTDFISLYQQSVNEGAQMIIGPLDKNRVRLLFDLESLPVPILAMNRIDDYGQAPSNLYQFALAPQDEAQQIADIAFLENNRHALVIAPIGSRGSELSHVFDKRLQALGGQTIAYSLYSGQEDYSKSLKESLLLNDSEDRAKRIQRLAGQSIEFNPRRREDIDMVFMLARPQQARSLKPLLAYHYAGDLPVYGTSRLYTGFNSPKNRDLNGVRFTDMPWILEQSSTLKSKITQELNNNRPYQRMYALGVDSYQLHPRLRQLTEIPNSRVYGQTGTLKLNEKQQIERRLLFAQIRNSKATIIPMAIQTGNLDHTTKEGNNHDKEASIFKN